MATEDFFDEQSEQSEVKSRIVAKYFDAWARIMIKQARHYNISNIAYVDLFCGRGRYKDGNASTPLLVLERAIADPDMRKMLVTLFNDKNTNCTQVIADEIRSIPGIEKLENKPLICNLEVGEQIKEKLEELGSCPKLVFVDPWGYKGLSLDLIGFIIKNWGCDCIFFFNYNRINPGVRNPKVEEHMNSLFGQKRADILKAKLYPMSPHQRELTIVESISEALQEIGGQYVLPFGFKNDSGKTSHHLIFVSKHVRGYEIMKEIMAKESSSTEQGVASFDYNPATIDHPLLFELFRPLDDLENMLLDEFAGKKNMTRQEIYEQHNVGKRYIRENYRDILLKMEAEGKIKTTYTGKRKRQEGTFSETKILVTFPEK
ncbi:MAG TPA: three-Cys-motif partner protein TcmP [Oscillatoriaceae cyanobacterium M33_DOE_052]|uniref:Three-Cys-motif partner protein TcmP n=1 Tax=Planktothricoides sp. SpSt-374 TaxID=2282167 RepID=A0A7C3VRF0_9CYAN|nr:three-Cys-motif partner protein TcmP [Oscillatoriaceae cyanobacterium M33_DOE_052]